MNYGIKYFQDHFWGSGIKIDDTHYWSWMRMNGGIGGSAMNISEALCFSGLNGAFVYKQNLLDGLDYQVGSKYWYEVAELENDK